MIIVEMINLTLIVTGDSGLHWIFFMNHDIERYIWAFV